MAEKTVDVRLLQAQHQRLSVELQRLKEGGGGGTSGGMEARIARLESDMEHVKRGVDKLDGAVTGARTSIEELRIDFGRFDERSKNFPTKGFIFSVAAGLLAASGAVMAIVVRFLPAAQ